MIPSPLLVVTDRHGANRPLVETIRRVLDGGARWIWFRDKDLERQARRDLALECLAMVREAGGRLTIGGNADLAAEIGADGVHLSGRIQLGISHLIGVSTHSLAEICTAADAGANYVTFSPIFPTSSKPGYGPALGLASLSAASRYGLPVMALGGIGPNQAASCVAAGAAGVAVMGALMRADDPAAETRRFLKTLGAST